LSQRCKRIVTGSRRHTRVDAAGALYHERLREAAVKSGIQFTWRPAFFANGGGEGFIRLAYSWEPPERNYEGAKLIAQAIKNAR
jgi:DNA-binding transcriptional MocR family regulator